MARRRMFSLDVVDTDRFLDLPSSSQALYFHLGMRADDDGFVSSPKRITAAVNCSADDMKLLIAKGFIIPFASGVCVIRDWKINNYLRNDRHTPTRYISEKSSLSESNGIYLLPDDGVPVGIPDVSQMVDVRDTQYRLGKNNNISADKPQGVTEEMFNSFWAAYPKKKDKKNARKAFQKVKPEELPALLAALEVQNKSRDWLKDGGKYIPLPTTWLNGRRWEDEVEVCTETKPRTKELPFCSDVSLDDLVPNPNKQGEWIPRSELEGRA